MSHTDTKEKGTGSCNHKYRDCLGRKLIILFELCRVNEISV